MKIALVGNPNSGKTTLFNNLTGLSLNVGNWTGVTVDKKEGRYLKDKNITICDLPGIYSIFAYSNEESITESFIKKENPSVIINVVDGTNLERSLFLTMQLLSLSVPMVIAVNMYDEALKNQIKINAIKLEKTFGVPVLLISALKNINVNELIKIAVKTKSPPSFSKKIDINDKNFTKKAYAFINENLQDFITKKQTINRKSR